MPQRKCVSVVTVAKHVIVIKIRNFCAICNEHYFLFNSSTQEMSAIAFTFDKNIYIYGIDFSCSVSPVMLEMVQEFSSQTFQELQK